MEFSRFDICEAAYCFASDWHGGQFTKIYRILGRLRRLQYQPRPSLSFETLSEVGKYSYDQFKKKYGVKDASKDRARLESVQDVEPAGGVPQQAPG